ncbi:DUF5685 family protein [Bariatricus sp. SGI.154]|uniref:DUF5685 family protein n=1 Tax=Bariatricus sp. SGI.154 TaxID=3420549 RepID=UPI003D094B9D
MFGYIAINKAEMKFKDYDMYHSYYCGLCKRLKECYGIRGQVTLSYDMTFLIVLLTGLYEPETKLEVVNCIAHPLEKHAARTNKFTDYAAAVNLILSYYKCKDDWEDEHKKKSRLGAKLLNSKMKDIQKTYPDKIAVVSKNLKHLSILEQENERNLDLMAGLFGNIMAELFAMRQDEWEPSLRKIGFFLGKFIYLMDAYEDVEKDIRSGNYNPFKEGFQNNEHFAEDCKQLLTLMMAECSREFEKLPILLHADILRNILYSGVWCRYTEVTAKRLDAPVDLPEETEHNQQEPYQTDAGDNTDPDRNHSDTGEQQS